MFKQTTALLNRMLLIKQESVYCSLTKMSKIISKCLIAYARLVTETFGCAQSGLKLLWMRPQVPNKVVASSFCLNSWAGRQSRPLSLPWPLSPRALAPFSEAFPVRPLGSSLLQGFLSLQVWSGRITKHFSFRGIWWLLGFSYFCIAFTL